MNRLMVGRNGVRDPRINYITTDSNNILLVKDGPVDDISLECSVPGYFIEPHRIAYGIIL